MEDHLLLCLFSNHLVQRWVGRASLFQEVNHKQKTNSETPTRSAWARLEERDQVFHSAWGIAVYMDYRRTKEACALFVPSERDKWRKAVWLHREVFWEGQSWGEPPPRSFCAWTPTPVPLSVTTGASVLRQWLTHVCHHQGCWLGQVKNAWLTVPVRELPGWIS